MNYRQEIIQKAEQILNKPFNEMNSIDKSQLYKKN